MGIFSSYDSFFKSIVVLLFSLNLAQIDTEVYSRGLMQDLHEILSLCDQLSKRQKVQISFASPSLIAMLAVYMKKHQISEDFLCCINGSLSYLENIGMFEMISGRQHSTVRHLQGKSYVPLVEISSPEAVDQAANFFSGCIGSAFGCKSYELQDVISEIMDNVWSHAKAFGVAVAQQYGRNLEFCIADGGDGFLRVLRKAGLKNIDSDIDAILWAIQKEHTSAGLESDDGWAQHLPFDCNDSPYGDDIPTRSSQNNHAGLGLFKLLEFIKKSEGTVQILSGNWLYQHESGNKVTQMKYQTSWQGAVVSCSFNLVKLKEITNNSKAEDPLACVLQNFDF